MTNKAAKDILGVDKESEFLQSFVRVGIRSDCEEEEKRISIMNSSPKKGDLHKQTSDGRSESSDGKAPRMSKYSRGTIPLTELLRYNWNIFSSSKDAIRPRR